MLGSSSRVADSLTLADKANSSVFAASISHMTHAKIPLPEIL